MPDPRTFRLALFCAWLLMPLAYAGSASAPAGVTVAPEWRWPAKPITSEAQLEQYLRDTPAAASPLSALTPAGERRFLASLVFGERGLGGFGTDDLRYDLTHEQAWNVLRLFGEEGYAIGLSARTRARISDGRPALLEPAYDRLVAAQERDGHASLRAVYAEAFAPEQTRLATLGARDVELLFRAAGLLASSAAGSAADLADLRRDFAELERRQLVDRPHADALYDALLSAHQPEQARALLASQPMLDRAQPPTMRSASHLRAGEASVWVANGEHELWRLPLMLHDAAQVIVLGSPHCHFSQAAARDIAADPALRELFRAHAQWVAPASDIVDFSALLAWNAAYPEQRLAVAHDNAELAFATPVRTPVFFFLRHGELAATLVGWPGTAQREVLRQRLKDIGLLR